jgi:hypothetical protein
MDQRLFPQLPESAPDPAPAGGRLRLRTPERRQVELRALSLDQLIAPGHRVRLVWRFVEGLDLAPLYAGIKAVEGRPGHPPADPRLLVALWLYATVEGIGSARALARLCQEHLAFQWLCGGHEPQDAGRFPRRPRAGAGGVAGRQLRRPSDHRRGVPGAGRPGRGAGAGGGRGGIVPPPRELAGLPSPGPGRGRAAAPGARGRSRRRQPPPGGGAPAGGGRARAPGGRGPGAHRGSAGGAGGGRQAFQAGRPTRRERRR